MTFTNQSIDATAARYAAALTLTLTASQAVAVASIGSAASNDDVTPVLTGIHVTVQPGASGFDVTAVATDRYIVGRLAFSVETDDVTLAGDGAELLLTAKDWAEIAKAAKANRNSPIVITREAGEGRVSIASEWGSASRIFTPISSEQYPPVARLSPDSAEWAGLAEGTALDFGYLTRIDKLRHPVEAFATPAKHDSGWSLSQAPSDRDPRRGRIHAVSTSAPAGTTLDALVQPRTAVR